MTADASDLGHVLAEICYRYPFEIGISVSFKGTSLELGGDTQHPSASLIKLPIALALCHEVDANRVSLDERIPISADHRCGGTGVLEDLTSLETIAISDLMRLMISASDNMATNMLIDRLSPRTINDWCRKSGLQATELNRHMMDLEAIEAGIENRTSADDMVRCLEQLRSRTSPATEIVRQAMIRQQHRLGLPNGEYHADDVNIGNKTGSFAALEHDVALFDTQSATLAIAVLTRGAPDKATAFSALGKIGRLARRLATMSPDENS
jgi:beta-lactamase class A